MLKILSYSSLFFSSFFSLILIASQFDCTSNSNCKYLAKPTCSTGTCGTCYTDTDCQQNFPTASCFLMPTSTYYCRISCTADPSLCLTSKTVCSSGYCRDCQSDAECASTYGDSYKCFTVDSNRYCGICKTSSQCLTGQMCTTNFACVYCESDNDCLENQKCVGGECQCESNDGCKQEDSKKLCDSITKRCENCLASSDCTEPTKPVCDLSTMTCRACQSDDDCSSQACTPMGSCVDCWSNENCTQTTPYCGSDNLCYQCLSSSDCKNVSRPFCSDGRCRSCPTGTLLYNEACRNYTDIPPLDHCLEYFNPLNCTECETGYYRNKNLTCSKCDLYCKSCHNMTRYDCDPGETKENEDLGVVSKYAVYVVLGVNAVVALMTMEPYGIVTTIGFMQEFLLVNLYKISLPGNALEYLINANKVALDLLPSPLNSENLNLRLLVSEDSARNYFTNRFFDDAGHIVFYLGIGLGIILILAILSIFARDKLRTSLQSNANFLLQYVVSFYFANITLLTASALLEVSTFRSSRSIIIAVFVFASAALLALVMIFAYLRLRKLGEKYKSKLKSCRVLFFDFSSEEKLPSPFWIGLIIKKLLAALIICLAKDDIKIQIILSCIISIFYITFLLFTRPFDSKFKNVFYPLEEAILIIINILMITIYYTESSVVRRTLGWSMICAMILFLLILIVYNLHRLVEIMKRAIIALRTRPADKIIEVIQPEVKINKTVKKYTMKKERKRIMDDNTPVKKLRKLAPMKRQLVKNF